jgi:hemolysin D
MENTSPQSFWKTYGAKFAQAAEGDVDTVPAAGSTTLGFAESAVNFAISRNYKLEAAETVASAVAQQAKGMSDARKFGDQLNQTLEQARQTALDALAKAQSEAMLREEELTKARQKSHLQRLAAPVDGTVQQLAVHTLGGVVEAVRPLMVVVPYGALVVEAKVLNKDAGFVHRGQDVAVKLEAFPFTRYGTVPGRIESVSTDSVDDKKFGPVYMARVVLLQSTIDRGDRVVPLGPGMTATADIRTGRRSSNCSGCLAVCR